MTMAWPTQWRRTGVTLLGVLLLAYYGWLRIQLIHYDRKIRADQEAIDRLRPEVLHAIQARERKAALQAQQQFAEHLRAATVEWDAVFRQVAQALPPTLVLHTVVMDGSRMTLHGLLRYPPSEPEPYMAKVAGALKERAGFREVMVAVTPPAPDEPSVARVDLTGTL